MGMRGRMALVVLLVLFLFYGKGYAMDSMVWVAENEHLCLYICPRTAAVTVYDKESGEYWHSNPEDWERVDSRIRGRERNRMGSQLEITYFIPGDERRRMDTYNDSVVHNQFSFHRIPMGVRVEYVLGEMWSLEAYLPSLLCATSFETLLSPIKDERDAKLVRDLFTPVILTRFQDTRLPIFGVDKEKTFGEYTLVSPENALTDAQRRVLMESFLGAIVKARTDKNNRGDILFSDLTALIETPHYFLQELSSWDRSDLVAIFKKWGIDPKDIQENQQVHQLDVIPPSITLFSIPLEYTLEGPSLVVRIPVGDIVYPHNVVDSRGRYGSVGKEVTLTLHQIQVLPFFGATGVKEEGYMVLPDGGGALIALNNEKHNAPDYNQSLYGRDHSLGPLTEGSILKQSYLPVMGLNRGEAGYLGILEGGDSLARIRAAVAGRQMPYNILYPEFTLIPMTPIQLSASSKTTESQQNRGIWLEVVNQVNAYQERPFKEDIQIRYVFLQGERATYGGMAEVYREWLFGPWMVEEHEGDIPFILELIGAIPVERPFLGIPRRQSLALTTFKEAKLILERLQEAGITNIQLQYTGLFQGGVEHGYPRKLALDPSLGTKKEFRDLLAFTESAGIGFFPSVSFLYGYQKKPFDGFHPRRDAARYLDLEVALYYPRDVVPVNRVDLDYSYYILSVAKLEERMKAFTEDPKNAWIQALHLTDFGTAMNSDFRPGALWDRTQAKKEMERQLERLRKEGTKLLFSGAHAYVLPFANAVLNVPAKSSAFAIVDADIPFLSLVLSGRVDFAYEPMNYAVDMRQRMLKSIETGALPFFHWFYGAPSLLKGTDFDHWYSSHWSFWFEEATALYHEMNQVLRSVYGSPIVGHRQVVPHVFETAFSNGRRILVNYRDEAVEYEGNLVPSLGYLLLGGE